MKTTQNTYKHVCIHTNMHAQTTQNTQIHVYAHINTNDYRAHRTHTITPVYRHVHKTQCTYTNMQAHMHTEYTRHSAHIHTCKHICIQTTCKYTLKNTCIWGQASIYAFPQMSVHIHFPHKYICAQTQTHRYANTHIQVTNAQIPPHKYKHIHT